MQATGPGVAAISGTGIEVITVGRGPAAPARFAGVVRRTGIVVIAIIKVGREGASCFWTAAVIGAGVVVGTGEGRTSGTFAKAALVFCGAEIVVVTGYAVEHVYAAAGRVAVVGGADALVVAIGGHAPHALAALALVYQGAGI